MRWGKLAVLPLLYKDIRVPLLILCLNTSHTCEMCFVLPVSCQYRFITFGLDVSSGRVFQNCTFLVLGGIPVHTEICFLLLLLCYDFYE